MPSRARRYVGMPDSAVPSNMISPSSGRNCPQTQLNNVVLPAPFGPTRPTLSPGATENEMLWTGSIPPKDLQTPCRRRSGSTSAIGTNRDGLCFELLGFRLPGEEQAFEPRRRTTLLVLEHSLRMLGVRQRAEGEQHDGQTRTTEA